MQRMPLPFLVTSLAELEVINALQLRLFRREISPAQARASYAAFRADARAGVLSLRALPEAVYTRAARLATQWTAKLGTRTIDIMHVAAARALDADTFNTFDSRQGKLAKAAGLHVP